MSLFHYLLLTLSVLPHLLSIIITTQMFASTLNVFLNKYTYTKRCHVLESSAMI